MHLQIIISISNKNENFKNQTIVICGEKFTVFFSYLGIIDKKVYEYCRSSLLCTLFYKVLTLTLSNGQNMNSIIVVCIT